MSKGGRYAKQNPQHGRRKAMSGGMIALIAVAVVLVLAVAGLIGTMVFKSTLSPKNQVQQSTDPITLPTSEQVETLAATDQVTEAPTEAPTTEATLPKEVLGKKVINILLIGQQARKGEKSEGGRMSDTLILATLNVEQKKLTLTSFFRDTYVKIADYVDPNGKKYTCGKNRINMAYNLGYMWGEAGGAMQMVNETIYNNFDAVVDYDIEVDFDGFMEIIDLLDGVEIELTEAEAEYLNNDDRFVYYEVQPGLQRLDGMAALSYARMRKAKGDGDSDLKRTARQRTLITAVIDKMKKTELGDLQYIVEQAVSKVTTNMSNADILNCMWTLLPILPELQIETGTCPIQGGQYSWGKMVEIGGVESSVMMFSERLNKEYMSALTRGEELPEIKK